MEFSLASPVFSLVYHRAPGCQKHRFCEPSELLAAMPMYTFMSSEFFLRQFLARSPRFTVNCLNHGSSYSFRILSAIIFL